MQRLQWNISPRDDFGEEDTVSPFRLACYRTLKVERKKHLLCLKSILARSTVAVWWILLLFPSPIYLLLPHVTSRGLVSRLAKRRAWGTSAPLLFGPSIRLSSSHEMSHMRHGQGTERKQWFYINSSSRFPLHCLNWDLEKRGGRVSHKMLDLARWSVFGKGNALI